MTTTTSTTNGLYTTNSRKYSLIRKDSFNKLNTSTEADALNYSLADVYDDAAVIGSELEKIINNYGSDVLKDLMPKVISVLELLESLTIKKERENDELNELSMKINSLEMEKTARHNERDKFEKELEEIDEKWKQETYRLIGMINRLKDENKRLNESLDQNRNLESKHNEHLVIKQEELDYIRQIKEENIKLKEMMRLKDREIEQKNADNEGLLNQIDRLSSTMLNLRRKQILAQNQIEKMVKAKAEIECALTEKEHQLNIIKEKFKIKNVSDLKDETQDVKESATLSSTSSQEKLSKDLTNLLIYDANDPNRPRFTLKELQKVLMEKNELTIKLDQTQDELEQLKNQDQFANNSGEVQGPINREPEEKLDPSSKQTQSGIRRLYVVDSNNILVVVDLYLSSHTCLVNKCIDSLDESPPMDIKCPERSHKYFPSLLEFTTTLSFCVFMFNLIYIYLCFNNIFNFIVYITKLFGCFTRLCCLFYKNRFYLIFSISLFTFLNIKYSILVHKYLFRFFKNKILDVFFTKQKCSLINNQVSNT